jgi:uracil-DNA glycosylase
VPDGDLLTHLRFLRSLGITHLPVSGTEASVDERKPTPSQHTDTHAVAKALARRPAHQHTDAPAHASVLAQETDLFEEQRAAETAALSPAERRARLEARAQELVDCDRCKLCPTRNRAANRLVYGAGNPEADIVFVGEGPGEEEDKQGIPFVGRAGELLTKIIGAMGLRRDDVYICNVVKHRAPGNRDPEADEIEACEPFLLEQLDLIQPRVLVTMGNCATKTLLRTKTGITRMRGTWQTYHGIPTMPTFHPAYILRSYTRTNREAVWSDMKAVMAKAEGRENRES